MKTNDFTIEYVIYMEIAGGFWVFEGLMVKDGGQPYIFYFSGII